MGPAPQAVTENSEVEQDTGGLQGHVYNSDIHYWYYISC